MFHDFINDDIYIDQDECPKFYQVIRFNGDNLSEIKMMFPEHDCDAGILGEEWAGYEPITYGLKYIDLTQPYCVLNDGYDVHTVPVGGYFMRCIGEWNSSTANVAESVSEYKFICSFVDSDHLGKSVIERSEYVERLMAATKEAYTRHAKK